MHLAEVEVRHWRGLTKTLAALSPRLNLVLGPNEAGKSRLFQAIHYALMETYKGAAGHKKELASWTGNEPPFVRIMFNAGGHDYELQKQFLKSPYCQLAGRGATLKNEDAEEALRVLLGTRAPGVKGADVEDMGIWAVTMVAQGTSRNAVHSDLGSEAKVRLQERLSAEIGVAAISATGQRLMALAEEEYLRFFTPSGTESKTCRDPKERLEVARLALQIANDTHSKQGATASQLARARGDLTDLEARLRVARHAEGEAKGKADSAAAAKLRVSECDRKHGTATLTRDSLERDRQNRAEADAAVERMQREIEGLVTELAEGAQSLARKETDSAGRKAEVDTAEVQVRERREAVEAARRNQRRSDLVQREATLTNRVDGLDDLERNVRTDRADKAAITRVDDSTLAQLRRLEQSAVQAAAKLQGAAVSVAVYLHQAAVVDGTHRKAEDVIQIDIVDDRSISIGEVATVEIRPGAGGLAQLRDAKSKADAALARELENHGVSNIDLAADNLARIKELEAAISAKLTQAKMLAEGKTNAQLAEELAAVRAELQRLGSAEIVDQDEAALAAALATAEDHLTHTRSAREASLAAESAHRQVTAGKEAERDQTQREMDRLKKLYEGRQTLETINQALTAANAAVQMASSELQSARDAFEGFGGTGAASDWEQARRSVETLQNRVRERRTEVDSLQGILSNLLEQGGYDMVQAREGDVATLEQECARIEVRASAAKRLWDVLREERAKVVERLVEPVIGRIRPYLKDLFPGSTLAAGQDLDFKGLQTGNLPEPYEALSGGAQEQIALLTRLGLAEVLAGGDRLPVLLDDALVNTDPDRIKLVHKALYRAANRLQIVLFSCHEILYDDLGADQVISLAPTRI